MPRRWVLVTADGIGRFSGWRAHIWFLLLIGLAGLPLVVGMLAQGFWVLGVGMAMMLSGGVALIVSQATKSMELETVAFGIAALLIGGGMTLSALVVWTSSTALRPYMWSSSTLLLTAWLVLGAAWVVRGLTLLLQSSRYSAAIGRLAVWLKAKPKTQQDGTKKPTAQEDRINQEDKIKE